MLRCFYVFGGGVLMYSVSCLWEWGVGVCLCGCVMWVGFLDFFCAGCKGRGGWGRFLFTYMGWG